MEYINIHGTIRSEGHVTLYGKYYDSEFDDFLDQAVGDRKTGKDVNWGAAKLRREGLLRGMLIENYFRYDSGKRFRLAICLFLASIGYTCIAIPSADLFIKVIRVVLKPLAAA